MRDGDKWYPAIVKQHEKWHGGLFERGNDVDLVYGTNLVYKVLPGGVIEPEILNPIGTRHVEGSDSELTWTGKDIVKYDGLRDWYLLAPEDLMRVQKHGQMRSFQKPNLIHTKTIGRFTTFRRYARMGSRTYPHGGPLIWI